jgi:hypothetical protein
VGVTSFSTGFLQISAVGADSRPSRSLPSHRASPGPRPRSDTPFPGPAPRWTPRCHCPRPPRTSMEVRTPVSWQVVMAGPHAPRRLSARRAARRRCSSVAGMDAMPRERTLARFVAGWLRRRVAVPVGRPVGLFNTVEGDHLVCRPERGAPRLGWASSGDHPQVNLPMPPQFCPPEGVPGDAELSGAVVPVREGDPEAGLLLLLSPADGRALGTQLVRRVPELAARVASDRRVGAVACRWSCAFQLPLPGRDGEPGSSTTITPVFEHAAGRYTERRGGGRAAMISNPASDPPPSPASRGPSPLLPGVTVALVPGPTTALVPGALPALRAGRSSPRRVLRMPLAPGRVHLPGTTYGRAVPPGGTA